MFLGKLGFNGSRYRGLGFRIWGFGVEGFGIPGKKKTRIEGTTTYSRKIYSVGLQGLL